MKLYIVNPSFMRQEVIDKIIGNCPGIGVLIAFNHRNDVKKIIKMGFKDIMIDSGAFYSFKKGVPINIEDLLDFYLMLKETYPQINFTFVSLDIIGGNDNGWSSYKNWQYMKDKVKCIPTFHYGDDWEILNKYVEESDYVALGGLVPIKSKPTELNNFLTKVFHTYPDHKFHLFGINSVPIIKKFNIFSADASTWVGGVKFGKLLTPWGDFCVSKNSKTRISYFDAEKYGVLKILNEHGIEFPLPEKADLQMINYVNVHTLYNEIVNANKQFKSVIEMELF